MSSLAIYLLHAYLLILAKFDTKQAIEQLNLHLHYICLLTISLTRERIDIVTTFDLCTFCMALLYKRYQVLQFVIRCYPPTLGKS